MDEFNRLKIDNSDGISSFHKAENKRVYANDEKTAEGNFTYSETEYSLYEEIQTQTPNSQGKATPAAPSAADTAIKLTATLATAAVSAATLVVLVVAAMLSVNVSLVFASFHSLTFEISSTSDKPLIARLYRDDTLTGEYEINERFITFYDLEEETEYTLTVVDSETENERFRSVFATSAAIEERVEAYGYFENEELFIGVYIIDENSRQDYYESANNDTIDGFYTIRVIGENGEILYAFDETEKYKEIRLAAPEIEKAYVKVTIGGKVVAFALAERYE